MEKRTAEIIMVLKGNSNLTDDAPARDIVYDKYSTNLILTDNEYFYLLALYMSDSCNVPISYYYKNPQVIEGVIRTAVVDYIKTCDNPGYFLYNYFENKDIFERESDLQHWCFTLRDTQVKERDKVGNLYYINGFTEENTTNYKRQRPYFEDFAEQQTKLQVCLRRFSMYIEELERKYKELGEEIKRLKEEQRFRPYNDKLFLLSVAEYDLVKENIKKYCAFQGNWWWLRSPYYYDSLDTYSVDFDSDVGYSSVFIDDYGVAPAFIEKTNEKVGTRKIKYNFPFIYVGNDIWISENFIFWSRFDEKSNDYEHSEIRRKILEWANNRK